MNYGQLGGNPLARPNPMMGAPGGGPLQRPPGGYDPSLNPILNPQNKPPGVDQGNYGGGYSGGEDAVAQQNADYANSLMGRGGPQMGMNQTDIANQSQDRNAQQAGLGMFQAYAQGKGPSVAQAQTYGAMGQGIAAMNAGAQNRGGPTSAMGQGGQQLNAAAMQGAGSRAQEQAGLMSAYGKAATGMRGADVSQYGADAQQALKSQQLAQQQNILNANTNLASLGQENQFQIGQMDTSNATYQQMLQSEEQGKQQDWQTLQNGINTGEAIGKTMTGGMSDRRVKENISMMGAYRG